MGIETIIGMIPKGGKYAKSVVNFVHKVPQNWEKFKSAIQQIERILKQGKLRLDGKQKTNFEANKNILKIHEKVTKEKVKYEDITQKMWKDRKEYPPFNTSKEDFTKGWKPTVIERQNLRKIYKDKLNPPERLYTKEMEAIDEELNELMLYGEGKYAHLSPEKKAELFKKLQTEMDKLIKIAKKNDLSNLSLSQLNKKSHDLQKRIREIADNPNIKGDVHEGPKRDMIKALYDSENPALTKARHALVRKNSIKKYGDKYPVLDPENNAFIITGLDEFGHPIKVGRFTGKFSATKDKQTGELTRKEGTSYYDKWNAEKNQIRKPNEEMWHETVDAEGKTIMSNPDYKIPEIKNMEIWNELYSDVSINELAKRGHNLKDIDMLVKGREVYKHLKAQEAAEPKLDIYEKLHERSGHTSIKSIMEDLYLGGDDVYKMSVQEWVKKIPEYFAEGGRIGFKRGLTSAPWLRGKSGSGNIKAWRGKEGWKEAQKLAEKFNLKNKALTGGIFSTLVAATEAGIIGIDEIGKILGLGETGLYKPSDFYRLWKNYLAKKEALKRNKARKTRGGPEMQEDYYSGYYKEQMPKLTWHEMKGVDEEKISPSEEMRNYIYPPEKRNEHATGGVSNLFRQRYSRGKAVELVTKLPEFLKFVERLLIKASNEIRQGIGKWKGLNDAQRVTQHDNLTKLATNFQKTKKFDKSFNEYFGIDAEKAFIEAQSKVKSRSFSLSREKLVEQFPNIPEEEINRIMKLSVEEQEKILTKLFSGQTHGPVNERTLLKTKYPGITDDLLDKILVDNNPQRKAEVLATMDEYLKLRQVGKGEEEAYEIITESIKKPTHHATGGLIPGYATGGVSNLFRSR